MVKMLMRDGIKGRQMAEKTNKKCSEIGRTDSQLERYQHSLLIMILVLLALLLVLK